MTQAQYDIAKDIILDLLGWGVPPEYLVSCGLSREIVYYVFLELNLRLPSNLDTTGLLPPIPPSYTFASPEPMSPALRVRNAPRPRVSHSPRRSTGDLHPSLPQKPPAPQGATDVTPLSATAAPFVPSATLAAVPMQLSDEATPPSLIDMEQQRRQELLARKAVLASRRKQMTSSNTTPPSIPVPVTTPVKEVVKEVEKTPVVTTTVDDFLNSIGPVNGDAAKESSSIASSDDQMDVDDQIPGLSSNEAPPEAEQPRLSEPPSVILEAGPANSVPFPPPSESEGSTRSASVETGAVAAAEKSESSGSSTPRLQSVGPRRATKRPVAADFVDMEPGSSRPHPYHHAHQAHHAASNHTHPRRRLQTFAGLTHTRRIVIDLSDSESDADEAANGQRSVFSHPSRPPTRLGVSASLPIMGTPSSPGGTATPSALLEKEQEIKKMRELIAQRERARLHKLSAVSVRPVFASLRLMSPTTL